MDLTHETRAQRDAEQWLEECYETSEDADSGFCGCTTCIVREVLTAATPHLYRALIELLRDHQVEVPPNVENLFADQ